MRARLDLLLRLPGIFLIEIKAYQLTAELIEKEKMMETVNNHSWGNKWLIELRYIHTMWYFDGFFASSFH